MKDGMHEARSETDVRSMRVVLADDHAMFREGLAGLLYSRGGVEVVGQVPNEDELVALTRDEKPDVMLGALVEEVKEGLRELLSVSPPRVAVVSARRNMRLARELAGLGVSAYVHKSASVEHLLDVVWATVSHPEGTTILSLPRGTPERAEKDVGASEPSGRKPEVLLVARGLSNRQIASCLYIAESTVKRRRSEAFRKALAKV